MTNWLKDWEDEKEEREERESVVTKCEECEPVVTKRGVFKSLEMSPYEVKVKDRTLKFSSRAKMKKFSLR